MKRFTFVCCLLERVGKPSQSCARTEAGLPDRPGRPLPHGRGSVRLKPFTLILLALIAPFQAHAQVGACCLGSASCVNTDSAGCALGTGEFLGAGTSCKSAVCEGACCLAEKQCTEGARDDCAAGEFQGAGSACATHCPAPLGATIAYQGQLKHNGTPVNDTIDLEASLWTAQIGGDQVGEAMVATEVEVVHGLFTAHLHFRQHLLRTNALYLQVAVRRPHDPSGKLPFSPLSPRQLLTTTPYALQTRGLYVNDSGNVGIGTTDPQAALHVEGGDFILPGLRVFKTSESVNVIGGSDMNQVSPGVNGATISGGGELFLSSNNRVTDDFGTVGGGGNNQAGDGAGSLSDRAYATVGGGLSNTASGGASTVGGGFGNVASGGASTVVGGEFNTAGGNFSFAAGRRARVRTAQQTGTTTGDQGTFIWSDSTNAEFASTGANQFLIRAGGGVGIGTNGPVAGLHVNRQPLTFGGTLALEGTNHTYMSFFSGGVAGGRRAWLGFGGANSTVLTIANENEGGNIVLSTGSSGRVGINLLAPSYALELPNSADVAVGRGRANAWVTYSSIRWKDNVRPIGDALGKLLRLTGVEFDWKTEHGGAQDIGFVAEDVGKVLPDIVSWESDGEHAQGLAYGRLTALLVEAVKELDTKVAQKDAQIAALADRLTALEQSLVRSEERRMRCEVSFP